MYIVKYSASQDDWLFAEITRHIAPWFKGNFHRTVGKSFTPLGRYIEGSLRQLYLSEDSYVGNDLKSHLEGFNRLVADVTAGRLKPLTLDKELDPKSQEFLDDIHDAVIFAIENLAAWRKECVELFKKGEIKSLHIVKSPCNLHKKDIIHNFENRRKANYRHRKLPIGYLLEANHLAKSS